MIGDSPSLIRYRRKRKETEMCRSTPLLGGIGDGLVFWLLVEEMEGGDSNWEMCSLLGGIGDGAVLVQASFLFGSIKTLCTTKQQNIFIRQ